MPAASFTAQVDIDEQKFGFNELIAVKVEKHRPLAAKSPCPNCTAGTTSTVFSTPSPELQRYSRQEENETRLHDPAKTPCGTCHNVDGDTPCHDLDRSDRPFIYSGDPATQRRFDDRDRPQRPFRDHGRNEHASVTRVLVSEPSVLRRLDVGLRRLRCHMNENHNTLHRDIACNNILMRNGEDGGFLIDFDLEVLAGDRASHLDFMALDAMRPLHAGSVTRHFTIWSTALDLHRLPERWKATSPACTTRIPQAGRFRGPVYGRPPPHQHGSILDEVSSEARKVLGKMLVEQWAVTFVYLDDNVDDNNNDKDLATKIMERYNKVL
ncbi:hypothetical protein FN846DRAFT_908084 [Sphaerosporella brunnea]|uniref:Fungal-type protein kinase domain-containing protein n=1 Tax=Sphaerosporella brunnea TaxID=1250544 RepID=A0A5J5EU37_9PEZI|nr:hypothetical protein FN846DRAFT_908084 [Sphaerosporella brunnea]